jgi:hypothetical protein
LSEDGDSDSSLQLINRKKQPIENDKDLSRIVTSVMVMQPKLVNIIIN